MRSLRLALALTALAACTSDAPERRQIAAYDTLDACTVYQQEEDCLANADRCVWYGLGKPCTEGEPCVTGVCQDIDPCRVHTDADTCAADSDNTCAWAEVELCPGDDCGDGGFCYQVTDDQDCTCVCPLAPCQEGEECPPCECDCVDDDGGDTCTCSGTVCPDDDPDCVPDPIECVCEDDGGGGDGCGTCTCSGTVCPDGDPNCIPDPIECDCEDTEETCVCPECPPGETCAPCECDPTGSGGSNAPTFEGDPCLEYADEATCSADTQCAWLQNQCPLCPECAPGVECDPCECEESFSCRFVGDSDCTCVCPECPPGVECPPCECTCDSCGSGGSDGSG